MADTVREQCARRLAGLKAVRQPYEADYREIAQLAAPMRSAFLSDGARKRRANASLYDGHAIRSFRTLAGGMTSGMSSRSRPWFRLTLPDHELASFASVAAWLGIVEEAMYRFLGRTNFYEAVQTGYLELGLFGTEATAMIEHPKVGAVCQSLTAGEYWIAQSDANRPDTLYRSVPMSVLQVVQAFGLDGASAHVRSSYDRANYDEIVPVFHAIEPNVAHDAERPDNRAMQFRSVWWDERDDRRHAVLRESGYNEQIFWAPRWATVSGSPYGYSPGFEALPDMRELQLQAKRKGEAVDFHIKPEMIAPAGVKLRRIPGSVVTAADVDAKSVIVPYQIPYQSIQAIRLDIEDCRRAIDMAAYADLFMAITNMAGVQPRTIAEIASRNEEKLTQLGPVIERVENEKLRTALDRSYAILDRQGLLPPPPEELQGQEIKFEFVSILAQMQRMIGLEQIERTLAFAGNLAAADPQVLDNLDGDQTLREYADRAGMPPRLMRDVRAVKEMRAQREQAAQAQQMMAAAGPAKDGVEALKLLSETDGGQGQSLLQSLGGMA